MNIVKLVATCMMDGELLDVVLMENSTFKKFNLAEKAFSSTEKETIETAISQLGGGFEIGEGYVNTSALNTILEDRLASRTTAELLNKMGFTNMTRIRHGKTHKYFRYNPNLTTPIQIKFEVKTAL